MSAMDDLRRLAEPKGIPAGESWHTHHDLQVHLLARLRAIDPATFGAISYRHLVGLRARYGNVVLTMAMRELVARREGPPQVIETAETAT
jgi:hypothetical protein